MMKKMEIHGQLIELYSLDNGRTWSSSPQAIVAYGQRKQMLSRELQKTFKRLVEMEDPDPNTVVELAMRMNPRGH